MSTALVWFRKDLRLHNNPALAAACAEHDTIIPVFIYDSTTPWPFGGAAKWWLHHSLSSLAQDLAAIGAPLHVHRGTEQETILQLIQRHNCTTVYWNRRYDPHGNKTDNLLKGQLKDTSISVKTYNSSLLFEPWEISTQQGTPMKVFTPFWKRCSTLTPPKETPAPSTTCSTKPEHSAQILIQQLDLLPQNPNWATQFPAKNNVGEAAAHAKLNQFLEDKLSSYHQNRDFPARAGTSLLSPHLAFGEISPRTIYWAVEQMKQTDPQTVEGANVFLSEIGWREFSYHLLYHFPTLPKANWKNAFDAFPWVRDDEHLKAWQQGRTGYPLVDAGMRQLWQTGTLHNRLRMICASFLIKDLMIDWRDGQKWFWDTLVDADLASNAAGWQWVAGSGADASPYFRIFNPITQSQKFDPDGTFIRRFVPELAALPDKYIHAPWTAPKDVLNTAGIALGGTYPKPIVNHTTAREAALAAYKKIR